MEKIASDLKASEMKQRDLSKAYEALHSQASAMLVLTVQWKDLQENFDSTRDAIRTRFEELQEREKQLEAKESKFRLEIETKQDELFGVQKLVDEKVQEEMDLRRSIQKHREEIECEEKRVLDLQKLVVDKERECGLIDKRIQERTKKLNWVERRIEEKSNLVESKWKELNKCHEDVKVKLEEVSVIDGAIKQRQEKMESKQEEIKEAQMLVEELKRRVKSKEEKLSWIEKSIEDSSKLANSKEEEVRVIRGSLDVYRESIKSKESELDAILESLEGKKKDIDVKEEQMKTLQRLIEGSEKELKLKEEKLREEALKVEEYSLRNREMEEWSCKLELKEREVDLKEKQTVSKMEEFKKKFVECEKELNSLSSELKVKEQQLKQEAEELELARKQCGVVAEVKIGRLQTTPANNVASSSASDQSNINTTDSGTLQLCTDEHMKKNDSMSNNISSLKFLQQESSEPAKLVLDAILQGFYLSNLTGENKESDLVLIRRTCIVLLEELRRVSSQVNPELREEAMKCASDWKGKMIVESENWLEILGFSWIVTTYELTSSYDGKELQHLLDVVAQHEQAMGLSRALGTTKKAPACSNISSPVKIEKQESQVADTEATISSLTTAITIDARHLQELQNEQFREAAYSAFKGIIYDLIGKKRLTEAVGLIYTVKLFDKFPPAQVLKEYVDNERKCCQIRTKKKKLVDGKDKITDEHIADLRVVIQCIKDYKLESEYSPDIIEKQIALSESSKKLRRTRVVPSVLEAGQQQKKPLKNVELQEQKKQKKDQPTSNAKLQEVEQKAFMVEQQGQQQEQKTSIALEKVKQIASNKVEKQQQLKKQKASKVEQHEQQQEQKTCKAKLPEKAMQKTSKKVEKKHQLQQQEKRKVSTAKLQEKVEHTTSTKVENQQQLQKQEEKKTSMAKPLENAVQKASNKVAERQQQQEQKTSKTNLQEKVVQQPSNRVQEQLQQQEQNASKVKQQQQQEQIAFEVKQQQTNGNKRSSSTFAPRFDHQQQFDNKYQRTSTVADRPFRVHPDHPDYTNPSSSTWRHGSYGYQGQFHPATYNNYEAHANYGNSAQFGNNPGNGSSTAYYGYGTGHNPRLNQSYPGLPRRAPR